MFKGIDRSMIDLMAFKVNNRMNVWLYHVAWISDTYWMKIDIITRQRQALNVFYCPLKRDGGEIENQNVYKNFIVIQNTIFPFLPWRSSNPKGKNIQRWWTQQTPDGKIFLRHAHNEMKRDPLNLLYVLKNL